MKFLVGSFIFFGVNLMIFFGAMATTNAGLIVLTFLAGSVFAWPMVVVSVYRLFTGAAGGRLTWVSDSRSTVARAKQTKSVMGDL